MTRVSGEVPDNIWKAFNHIVIEKYGQVRDKRNICLAEAIQEWNQKHQKK